MKILFKNITKYNKENCDNFINFHYNKYAKKEIIKKILLFVCIIYILVLNIIHKNLYFIAILLVLGLITYFFNKNKKQKIRKERKKIKEYTFYFYKRHIKIRYRRESDRILYFRIKKVFETDKNFFLYTDDTHSLILDKEGFVIGNKKEFSKFIKRKCPLKYSKETKYIGGI